MQKGLAPSEQIPTDKRPHHRNPPSLPQLPLIGTFRSNLKEANELLKLNSFLMLKTGPLLSHTDGVVWTMPALPLPMCNLFCERHNFRAVSLVSVKINRSLNPTPPEVSKEGLAWTVASTLEINQSITKKLRTDSISYGPNPKLKHIDEPNRITVYRNSIREIRY